jgi:hypothetical protein
MMAPNRKVNVGVVAGAVVVIGVWAAKTFAQLVVPVEIGMAATTVITFIVQYIVPEAAQEGEQ